MHCGYVIWMGNRRLDPADVIFLRGTVSDPWWLKMRLIVKGVLCWAVWLL